MKKTLSILLALAMVTTLSTSVSANQSTVTYTVGPALGSYTVTIPETIIVLPTDNDVSIKATTNLDNGQTLRVGVETSGFADTDGKITLTNGSVGTVDTYFYYGDSETKITTASNIVAEFQGLKTDVSDPTKPLKVKGIDTTGKAAGTYSKTIEFTVSVDTIQ